MSFALGLTGSIGMGKSTTAQMFVDEGCVLWDADAAVHRLYSRGGAAVEPMQATFPAAIVDDAVNRDALKQIITNDPAALKQIEGIVHPLVAADRATFRANATADILVFDIPLLFETGGDAAMDAVACVSIPADEQKRRVMARGTMSEAQFEQIRTKQMPNDEKCARSDFVIVTDSLDHARAQVQDVVRQIRAGLADA
ncbi:dephospho-CoA kinase [Ruegeria lacuscaerulensis]|uniref:dephospho-CoA kinase n=1 Tax=Ruegeria lacuscaerulensis TaxID=55218 RepID=UPI00147CA145|nr:dephospho-CoA kinase [Ruegeria lacuscaerulensis]